MQRCRFSVVMISSYFGLHLVPKVSISKTISCNLFSFFSFFYCFGSSVFYSIQVCVHTPWRTASFICFFVWVYVHYWLICEEYEIESSYVSIDVHSQTVLYFVYRSSDGYFYFFIMKFPPHFPLPIQNLIRFHRKMVLVEQAGKRILWWCLQFCLCWCIWLQWISNDWMLMNVVVRWIESCFKINMPSGSSLACLLVCSGSTTDSRGAVHVCPHYFIGTCFLQR